MATSHIEFENVLAPKVSLDWAGRMMGSEVKETYKSIGDLIGIFNDGAQVRAMDPMQIVYRVQSWCPVDSGTAGGLFWGLTTIEPGKVGDEYFMTHGHFHANPTRAEFYATVIGEGMLIEMDSERKTWGESMTKGSLHYIDGHHAHRVANTGTIPLVFWACWHSDAGYDYGTIAKRGFGGRLIEKNGRPVLIPND